MSAGLFVLRYVASKAGLNAPTLTVASAQGSGVDLISPNEGQPGRLISPGDGLVVRAGRESFITVAVSPSHRNGSCDAELVLERVSTTLRQPGPGAAISLPEGRHAPEASTEIEILAHVARRGDIIVKAGEWICGPDLPMAIEGLEIRWPQRPAGIDLRARATISKRGLHALGEEALGSFIGTRARAAPITSLTLTLAGSEAEAYVLHCEALFLGQSVLKATGGSCTLTGPTGLEPLVGLRLSIQARAEQAAQRAVGMLRSRVEEPQSINQPEIPSAAREKASRVRIFRGARVKGTAALGLLK